MTADLIRATLRGLVQGGLALGLALAGAPSWAAPSWAAQYSLTELPMLEGFANLHATGLNASGQVVGFGYNGTILGTTPNRLGNINDGLAFVTGPQGTGTTVISPLAGHAWSRATAINDAGQVAGVSSNQFARAEQAQAFIAPAGGGAAAAITGLGGQVSEASAINASGQVAGYYKDAAGQRHAYLSSADGSSIKTLALTGDVGYVTVTDVTDDGRVIGGYELVHMYGTGFVTGPQGEGVQILSTSSRKVHPTGINAAGQITGFYPYPHGNGVFLREADGSYRDLDFSRVTAFVTFGSGFVGAHAMEVAGFNAAGQVAGSIISERFDDIGTSAAFISGPDGEGATLLDNLSFVNQSGPLGFRFTSVTGINDLGSFVANGSNGKAYLISVVPEPATYLTMLGGLALMGLAVGRRRRSPQSAPLSCPGFTSRVCGAGDCPCSGARARHTVRR